MPLVRQSRRTAARHSFGRTAHCGTPFVRQHRRTAACHLFDRTAALQDATCLTGPPHCRTAVNFRAPTQSVRVRLHVLSPSAQLPIVMASLMDRLARYATTDMAVLQRLLEMKAFERFQDAVSKVLASQV
eukprot:356687-Chlamydomonas_euryale.AAC.2